MFTSRPRRSAPRGPQEKDHAKATVHRQLPLSGELPAGTAGADAPRGTEWQRQVLGAGCALWSPQASDGPWAGERLRRFSGPDADPMAESQDAGGQADDELEGRKRTDLQSWGG